MAVSAEDLPDIRDERLLSGPTTEDIVKLNSTYVNHHQEHKNRLQNLDNLMDDRADVVWQDGTSTDEKLKIANMVKSDLEDTGRTAGMHEPNVICDADDETDKAQRDATERAQILVNYRTASRLRMERRNLAMDLAGGGAACLVVWPDYKT